MTSWKRRLESVARAAGPTSNRELSRLIPDYVTGDDRDAALALIKLAWDRDGFSTQLRLFATSEVCHISRDPDALTVEVRADETGLTDELTKLPTRPVMLDRLGHELRRARRYARLVAVMLVDVDRLGEINAAMGTDAGDAVLTDIARAATDTLRPGDSLTRVGGDEFVAVIPDIVSPVDARTVAERVRHRVAVSSKNSVPVTLSIGIGIGTDDDSAEDVLAQGEAALRTAKSRGGDQVELALSPLQHEEERRVTIDRRLRTALDNHDLPVVYEAGLDAYDPSNLVLVEIELDRERLGPADLVGVVAGSTGLLAPVTVELLNKGASDLVLLTGTDEQATMLCLRVMPGLLASHGFVTSVTSTLDRTGLAPTRLCLATPARILTEHRRDVHEGLAQLTQSGVHVVIDGFAATGLEIARLAESPVRSIRIDADVSAAISHDPHYNLAAILDERIPDEQVTILASDVDTETELDRLRAAGVQVVWGRALDPVGAVGQLDAVIAFAAAGVRTEEPTAVGAEVQNPI